MWKKIILIVILIIIIVAVVEMYCCQNYYRTMIDISDLTRTNLYHTNDGDILVSVKTFKTLPNGFYPIKPTMLIASQIESGYQNLSSWYKNINSKTIVSDTIGLIYPVFELINYPKYVSPTSSLNFASNNPDMKIVMSKKHNKEYFYVH